MFRITNNRQIRLALAVAAAWTLAGCPKPYGHRRLEGDCPQAAEVRDMLKVLRERGESGLPKTLRESAASGLDASQTQALQAALKELIQADSAELARIDRFGSNVYRATFRVSRDAKTTDAALLLVTGDGGRLRWAGPNT